MPFNRKFERNKKKNSTFFQFSSWLEDHLNQPTIYTWTFHMSIQLELIFISVYFVFVSMCVLISISISPTKKKKKVLPSLICLPDSFESLIESTGPLTEWWSKMNIQQQKIGKKYQIHEYWCTMSDGIMVLFIHIPIYLCAVASHVEPFRTVLYSIGPSFLSYHSQWICCLLLGIT